ncbi:MAG: glycoside hydrolase family 97 N-terminal domain-containing protein, partial [Bacteroidaceae bacterium]|nr:glycoside hydrolase family 97 N-terminal domain-containing protein [Bacteroidaceae bacterium]
MRNLFLTFALVCSINSFADSQAVMKSPDGKLVMEVNEKGGAVAYSVKLAEKVFLKDSPLGLVLNDADLSKGLVITKVSEKAVKESYTVPTIKQRNVSYEAVRYTCLMDKDGKHALTLECEMTNNDIAFRYVIPAPKKDEARHASVVKEEMTGYVLPEDATTYLAPQMIPMTGFAGTAPSYETHITPNEPMGKNGWGDGYVFPALFKNADKGWMLISETGTNGNYCGCHL